MTQALLSALEKRENDKQLISSTDAYRLIHSDADGFPGITVDRMGPALLVEVHMSEVDPAPLIALLADRFKDAPIFFKEKQADPNRRQGRQVSGATLDPNIIINEEGMKFRLDLSAHPHCGLFLDSRAVRRAVREWALGKRVLNLFSYTGGFGIAAALGGARSTTNIDQKKSALQKAEENYRLNDLKIDGRTFLKSDAAAYLKRVAKKNHTFDLIVLDPPPSAKRTMKDGFNTRYGYDRWVTRCLLVLSEGGQLAAGLNNPRVGNDEFLKMIELGAAAAGRVIQRFEPIPVDIDFPQTPHRPTARFVRIFV